MRLDPELLPYYQCLIITYRHCNTKQYTNIVQQNRKNWTIYVNWSYREMLVVRVYTILWVFKVHSNVFIGLSNLPQENLTSDKYKRTDWTEQEAIFM